LLSCVSVGVPGTVLYVIIWPKVRRVLSGDKVVVSSLLGSKYSGTQMSAEPLIKDNSLQQGSPAPANKPLIQIRPDDPIPSHIEKQIFALQGILRHATNQWYVCAARRKRRRIVLRI
jgi:hypothetical protein